MDRSEERNSKSIIGDFNNPFTIMDGSSRQKISKEK